MKTLLLAALLLPAYSNAVLISYRHDVSGRLTSVNYNGASRTDYVYDKNGSLLSRINSVTPLTAAAPQMAGEYKGIITNAIVNAGHTGSISLKVLANGTFSGKLTIQGVSFGFSGKFLSDGSLQATQIVIDRKAPLQDYTLTLALDVQGSTPSISGSISGDVNSVAFNSQISMQRDMYNTGGLAIGNGLVGKYTMLLSPASFGAGIPEGIGYATIVVNNKGAVNMTGKLSNNVSITQGSQIIGINTWPLYVPLHSNQGFIVGNMQFYSPEFSGEAIGGVVSWLKPTTSGTFHPAAFMADLDAMGALYVPPLANQRIIDLASTSPNAVFYASVGNLGGSISRDITIDTKNKVTAPVDAVALKLTLSAPNGFINGTFKHGTSVRTLSGVFLQDSILGAGFFPGSTESGRFSIEPPP